MEDDEILKAMKSAANDELNARAWLDDPLLENLVNGTLSESDAQKLGAAAAEDERLAISTEAFKPLSEGFKDSLADRLLAMRDEHAPAAPLPTPTKERATSAREPTDVLAWLRNLFTFDSPQFAAGLACAATLVVVGLWLPNSPSELPVYQLEMSAGDALQRGEDRDDTNISTFTSGSAVRLLVRPDAEADDDLGVRVFLSSGEEFLELQVASKTSTSGSVRLTGAAGTEFPVRDAPYWLVVVISRPESFPNEETVRRAAHHHGQTSGDGWQIMKREIRVQ